MQAKQKILIIKKNKNHRVLFSHFFFKVTYRQFDPE